MDLEQLRIKLNEPEFVLTPISQKPKRIRIGSAWNKGLTVKNERVKRWYESGRAKRKGHKPWNFGLTKETSEKVQAIAQKISADRGNPKRRWSEEKKLNFISKVTGHKGPIVSEEQRKRLSMLASNQRQWFSISSYELKIKQKLIEAGFIETRDFSHNEGIKLLTGRWKRPDFTFPQLRIIIEFDGEKWHKTGNDKDATRNQEYARLGYDVIILTEKTMNTFPYILKSLKQKQLKMKKVRSEDT